MDDSASSHKVDAHEFKWIDTVSNNRIVRSRYIEEWKVRYANSMTYPQRHVHITLTMVNGTLQWAVVLRGSVEPIQLATGDLEEAQAAAIAIWKMEGS